MNDEGEGRLAYMMQSAYTVTMFVLLFSQNLALLLLSTLKVCHFVRFPLSSTSDKPGVAILHILAAKPGIYIQQHTSTAGSQN
jgi:hypothetical protein